MQQIITCYYGNQIEIMPLQEEDILLDLNAKTVQICDAGKDVEHCETCNLWTEKEPVSYKKIMNKKIPSFEFLKQSSMELNFD